VPPGYASLENVRLVVLVVFGVMIVVWLVSAVLGVQEILIVDRLIAGERVSDAELADSDDRVALVGLLQTVGYVAGAVAFLTWLRRAYANLDAIAPGMRRYGVGWAVGGWFVPILFWWRPKQVVNDIWLAGDAEASRPPIWPLGVWWTGFIVTGFVSRVASRAYQGGDTNQELRDGAVAYLVSDSLDVVVLALAVLVVLRTTRRLDARARAVTTTPAVDDAPQPA